MKLWARAAGLLALFAAPVFSSDDRMFEAKSLQTCRGSNDGTVSVNTFQIQYTPGTSQADINVEAQFHFSGKVEIEIELLVYGYKVITKKINPCDFQVSSLCPLDTSHPLTFNHMKMTFDESTLNLPGESRFERDMI